MSHLLNASDHVVDASGFAGNLSGSDTDVQTALGTIDSLTLSPFQEVGAVIGQVTNTNSVALGIASPYTVADQPKLYIQSGGDTSATFALRVEDSTTDPLFEVRDDGKVAFSIAGAGLTYQSDVNIVNGLAPTLALIATGAANLSTIEFRRDNGVTPSGAISSVNDDLTVLAEGTAKLASDTGTNYGEVATNLVGNILLHQGDDSDGVGVVAVRNANTVPTVNPTNGGIIYVEAGALKFRGSSGTVTVIAPA